MSKGRCNTSSQSDEIELRDRLQTYQNTLYMHIMSVSALPRMRRTRLARVNSKVRPFFRSFRSFVPTTDRLGKSSPGPKSFGESSMKTRLSHWVSHHSTSSRFPQEAISRGSKAQKIT
jgi:hypothetical protein